MENEGAVKFVQLDAGNGPEHAIVRWYPDLGNIEVSGYYEYGCWSLAEFFQRLRITLDDCKRALGEG